MSRCTPFAFAAAFLLMLASAQAAPDQATETMFKHLLTAAVSNNYAGFVADCDDAMKAAITKPKLADGLFSHV